MSKFDFSLYDDEDTTPIQTVETKPKTNKKTFDFDQYEIPETEQDRLNKSLENDKFYQEKKAPDYSSEDLQAMSFQDKMKYSQQLEEEQRYLQSRGTSKGLASGLSFGVSQRYEDWKPLGEPGFGFGEAFGEAIPIAASAGLISIPFAMLNNAYKFGKYASAGLRYGSSVATGVAYETARQTGRGDEEYDPWAIAWKGAEFGLIHGLMEAVPAAYRWFKGLNAGQQSELLASGSIPPDLPPSKYAAYEQEVAPKLQQVAKQESETALKAAVEENDLNFNQKMESVKANHERNLYEISQKKQVSQEEFARAQQEYETNVKQIEAEYQDSVELIEKQNQAALAEQQQQQVEYEQLKTRQQLVNQAIQPKEGGEILWGGVTENPTDVGIRPKAPYQALAPVEIKVGDVVSPNTIADTAPGGRGNKTTAGQMQVDAIRANDAVDYEFVKDAYTISEELNSKINIQQSALVPELQNQKADLISIPKLSPVQEQKLSVIDAVLDQLTIKNEGGDIIGLNPVNNNVLQEQAKSLRYFMDFNFQHGNSRGILQPTVDALENGIAFGATMAGDESALAAHQNAKKLYSTWATEYDNPYIRPYRDVANKSYIETFDNSLNIDNFNAIDVVLNKSNASQQVAGMTRRSLVDKYLSPFYADPKTINSKAFNETMAELRAVLTPAQETQIRNQFNIAKQAQPTIKASKVEPSIEPKAAKLKEIPEKPKIPEFTKKPKEIKEPTVVKVPVKEPVKPNDAMRRAAHKLNMSTEDIMKKADTISGFREIKKDLLKTPDGAKTVKLMENYKNRDILFEGKIKGEFKGDELKRILQKGDNFDFISEIHGKEVALDMLEVAEQIAGKKITADRWKQFGKKAASLKVAHLLGIF